MVVGSPGHLLRFSPRTATARNVAELPLLEPPSTSFEVDEFKARYAPSRVS